MDDSLLATDTTPRRVHVLRRLLLCVILAWLLAFILANAYAPHLRDGRWPFKTYAAIAMHVRTTQFHVGVVALAAAIPFAARRRSRIAWPLAIVGLVAIAPEVRQPGPGTTRCPPAACRSESWR